MNRSFLPLFSKQREHREEIAQKTERITFLETQVQLLSTSQENTVNTFNDLQEQIRKLQDTNSELGQQNDILQTQVATCEQDLHDLKVFIQGLERGADSLREERNNLKARNADLEDEVARLKHK